MNGIPWATQDPAALAKAERSRRQLGALEGIIGVGSSLVRGAVQQGQREEAENDEIVRLRAALGLQEQKAVAQSEYPGVDPGLSETDLGTGQTTVLRPAGQPSPIDRGLRALGTFSRRAGVAAGFLPDTGGADRRRELARLKGQVELQSARGKLVSGLSKAIAGSKDPGAAVGKIAPYSGLGPGDLAPGPKPSRGATQWSTYLDAAGGDADLARRMYVKDQQDIRAKSADPYRQALADLMAGKVTPPGGTATEDHPESDQGATADPEAADVQQRLRSFFGAPETEAETPPGTSPPHPVKEHAAQRKAAVLRDARGQPLTQ